MRGFITNIGEATKENSDYRRVLYTTNRTQLVLMRLAPGEEIGEETHELDQFICIESGEGKVFLDGEEHLISAGHAVVIPEGTKHNIVNTGTEGLQLYTMYAPPEHRFDVREHTKADEREEHFDGETNL